MFDYNERIRNQLEKDNAEYQAALVEKEKDGDKD
jgi:hypothetical protein